MNQIVLARQHNHRHVELHSGSRGQLVGVLRKDGSYGYVPWLGFVDRQQAKALGGRPVKLEIARVGVQDGMNTVWQDVARGKHVHGCLVPGGAYAVTAQGVRIV